MTMTEYCYAVLRVDAEFEIGLYIQLFLLLGSDFCKMMVFLSLSTG